MQYEIMQQRLNNILQRDKMSDPEQICNILKGELSPIIQNYIDLCKDINVRFTKVGEKLTFSVEISAQRVRPFGYLPKI